MGNPSRVVLGGGRAMAQNKYSPSTFHLRMPRHKHVHPQFPTVHQTCVRVLNLFLVLLSTGFPSIPPRLYVVKHCNASAFIIVVSTSFTLRSHSSSPSINSIYTYHRENMSNKCLGYNSTLINQENIPFHSNL